MFANASRAEKTRTSTNRREVKGEISFFFKRLTSTFNHREAMHGTLQSSGCNRQVTRNLQRDTLIISPFLPIIVMSTAGHLDHIAETLTITEPITRRYPTFLCLA